jgi:hypothetical protein
MRILVATYHTMPGYSGGWTTPLDLLTPEHEVAYAVRRGRFGDYSLEGIRVFGNRPRLPFREGPRGMQRVTRRLNETLFGLHVRSAFSRHAARFVLCLDVTSASRCLLLGLPYAIRFHVQPTSSPEEQIRRLVEGALFTTGCEGVSIPGVPLLQHGEDLSRFHYVEHAEARSVLLLATLVDTEMPRTFVEGVARSGLEGAVAGDGPLRQSLEKLCSGTGGRVRVVPPVLRNDLPELMSRFQIGVACCERIGSRVFQMKVTEYQASGLYPLVSPWTHVAVDAPELVRTFETAGELAGLIDETASRWASTLDARRRNREYAFSRYGILQPKRQFAEILASAVR